MQIFQSPSDIRAERRGQLSQTWGLVPTMGFLHEGHLQLVRRARAENDRVAVSIFVNPAQFNDSGDLAAYPRDEAKDLQLLEAESVDLVWLPTVDDAYPENFQTYVEVEGITNFLEGAHRPGHFRGVTTIVNKLLNLFQPDNAYFGQKDAQQALVIQTMVRDLNINSNIVVCPIVREADGLAMSSRNSRLSPQGRSNAVCLYEAIKTAEKLIDQGENTRVALISAMESVINTVEGSKIDYISVADRLSLKEIDIIGDKGALISLAVYIDGVRLIDNTMVTG